MDIEKIQEQIKNTDSVAIILREKPEEHEFLIREALKNFFQNKGAATCVFPEIPEEIKNKWSSFLTSDKNTSLASEIFVRFPKGRFDIKEIGYEDEGDFFALKILTDDRGGEKNDVVVEAKPSPVNLLICLGSIDINHNYLREKISLPEEEKIIFIIPDNETLSEKVFEIIQTTEEWPAEKKNIPDLLLASLFLETNNFKKKITEGSLNTAHSLLSLGANKKLVDELIKKEFSLSFAQILGRTLSRTRLNESLKSNWAFVSKKDFEKAGIEKANNLLISQITDEIKEIIPRQPIFVILWEDKENNVWALLTTEKGRNEKETVGPFKSFSEAELKIQKTLKEII